MAYLDLVRSPFELPAAVDSTPQPSARDRTQATPVMRWLPPFLMLCGLGADPSWFIASIIETVWQIRMPARFAAGS